MNESLPILQLILYGVYYLLVGAVGILSLFGVYILTAHGRSRVLSLAVSLVYVFIFLSLLGASQITLYSIF